MIPAHVTQAIREGREERAASIRATYTDPVAVVCTRTTHGWLSWIAKDGNGYTFHEYHVNACLHLATPFDTRKRAERAEDHAFWIAVK